MSLALGQKRKKPHDNVGRRKKRISSKKVKQAAAAYHSSSEEEASEKEEEEEVGLPEEIEDDLVGDLGSSSEEGEDHDGGVKLPNLVVDEEKRQWKSRKTQQNEEAEDNDVDEEAADLDSDEAGSESGSDSQTAISDTGTSDTARKMRKRNDPTQFATSISKILSSKLTTSQRPDPVLSRSKDASTASKEQHERRLEAKAKKKLRQDKQAALERARDKDVKGFSTEDVSVGEVAGKERQLKKTAQRGVVKLFNAVRAAQVKGEEAAKDARMKGVIGVDQQKEQVNEMSKKGFLDLLVDGGR